MLICLYHRLYFDYHIVYHAYDLRHIDNNYLFSAEKSQPSKSYLKAYSPVAVIHVHVLSPTLRPTVLVAVIHYMYSAHMIMF